MRNTGIMIMFLFGMATFAMTSAAHGAGKKAKATGKAKATVSVVEDSSEFDAGDDNPYAAQVKKTIDAEATGKPEEKSGSAAGAGEIPSQALSAGELVATINEDMAARSPENTLDGCMDGRDNDGDSHVDCADQDCGIYAMCVGAMASHGPAILVKEVKPPVERTDVQCRDGVDNDGNGLVDCFDPVCQRRKMCKREIYERPRPQGKPMGIFVSTAFGAALPNYNFSDITTDSRYGRDIPFDPDFGGMMELKVGYAPIKWLGFGLNLTSGGTVATNRSDNLLNADTEDRYKYDGHKMFGHIGGFVRFMYEFGRFVPHLDIAGGYTYNEYHWRIYDGDNSWDVVDNDGYSWSELPSERRWRESGHFTMALEPGFDVFIVDRLVGLGMHAWLPVFASAGDGMDNVGIMFNITVTPTWREKRRLKEKYASGN